MIFYKNEKTGLFIDGANLYGTAKNLAVEIDYKKLLTFFSEKCRLVRAFYYTAIYEDEEYSPLRPLIDWLDYNGFTVVTKPVKEFKDDQGRRKLKGNMDIELAVDMLGMADTLDHVVLFSGDGDFKNLLEAMKGKGVRTSVVSSMETTPSMVADELRREADQFIELKELKDMLGRKSSSGGAPKPDPMAFEEFKMS